MDCEFFWWCLHSKHTLRKFAWGPSQTGWNLGLDSSQQHTCKVHKSAKAMKSGHLGSEYMSVMYFKLVLMPLNSKKKVLTQPSHLVTWSFWRSQTGMCIIVIIVIAQISLVNLKYVVRHHSGKIRDAAFSLNNCINKKITEKRNCLVSFLCNRVCWLETVHLVNNVHHFHSHKVSPLSKM